MLLVQSFTGLGGFFAAVAALGATSFLLLEVPESRFDFFRCGNGRNAWVEGAWCLVAISVALVLFFELGFLLHYAHGSWCKRCGLDRLWSYHSLSWRGNEAWSLAGLGHEVVLLEHLLQAPV